MSDTLQTIADRKARVRQSVQDAHFLKKLAEGYESSGAYDSEIRETVRAIYHQNEAIIAMLDGVGAALSSRTTWDLGNE